jgi:hypothetical protein
MFRGVGVYNVARPLIIGVVHGLGRFSRGGALGDDHDSRFLVGHRISLALWNGHDRQDDVNHGGDRHALRLHV